ncbi:hypothetical protein [Candidatus Amarobacter glycogenicus]|uniref:hypothetical protein n=1 Tax=Candidatus Amarobacter glycogenicus TaxID=3140699 RepID=UPI002A0F6C95|nr:hypothetical protein [Dehalococcoidia bacterium]
MTSSKSLPKPIAKSSYKFKNITAFDQFYQLTYMSATAAAGISRSKTFEMAAESGSPAANYFIAINLLVNELRFDYPEACRTVADKAPSDEIKFPAAPVRRDAVWRAVARFSGSRSGGAGECVR